MAQPQVFDAKAVEDEARRALRKSPNVWAWETARFSLYVLCRLIFAPWCLVWPAITVWLIWWFEGVGAREAIELFAAGPARSYAWIYVLGALIHSLAILGAEPYEWEVDRRVRAQVLNFATRTRWIKAREESARTSSNECRAPHGWERVEPGSAGA